MNTRQKSRLHILISSMLLLLVLPTQIWAQLEASGRIEGRVGLLSSGEGDEDNLVHMERVNLGIQQKFDFFGMNYRVTGGGLYRSSQALNFSEWLPEYEARAQFVPIGRMQVELFSYSQQRNPMQITQDTLKHQEQVSGVQFQSPLPYKGRFVLAYGTRSASRNDTDYESQFIKLQLEQKLLGMQVRIRGEQDLYSSSVTANEEDRSNFSIQWYGSPIKRLSWTGLNSLYRYGGNDFWRIYQRINLKLTKRGTLWTHLRNEQIAFNGSYVNNQSYDVDLRWKLNESLALQALNEGSKVKSIHEDATPQYHWRANLLGLHWRYGNQMKTLGVVQAGKKESYRFGTGTDMRFELEEHVPLLQKRVLSVELTDRAEGEYFKRSDIDNVDPQYDIDHELRLSVDLWPGQRLQLGNTFKLINHMGTDLEFSTDTLRNAFTHNIQLKLVQRRLRASIDHFTINEMDGVDDLRLHINTRFTYHLSPGMSLNWISMYRYQSDIYPDYLWLNTFIKINMRHFNWALEAQAQGDPDEVFKDNLSIWMRFVRQL